MSQTSSRLDQARSVLFGRQHGTEKRITPRFADGLFGPSESVMIFDETIWSNAGDVADIVEA
jgi:hypothetical protein